MEKRVRIGGLEVIFKGRLGLDQCHKIIQNLFTDTMKGVLYQRLLLRAVQKHEKKEWEIIWIPECLDPYGIQLHKNFDFHFNFYEKRKRVVKSALSMTQLPQELQKIIFEFYNDETRWFIKTQNMQLKSAMRRAPRLMQKIAERAGNIVDLVIADNQINALQQVANYPFLWGESIFDEMGMVVVDE